MTVGCFDFRHASLQEGWLTGGVLLAARFVQNVYHLPCLAMACLLHSELQPLLFAEGHSFLLISSYCSLALLLHAPRVDW